MKRIIASLMLVLITACAPTTQNQGMMQSGTMCEKCPCCQKMMKEGMMKDGKMQCPMMQGKAKDGMPCGCCEGMMEGGMDKMKPDAAKTVVPKADKTADHNAHHPK